MFLLAIAFVVQTQGPSIQSGPVTTEALSVAAVAASRAPVLDGKDDDEVWATAQLITGFREARPVEDADPKLPTQARIAYDERNLYFFVRALDQHPDSIVRRLSR